MIVNHSWYAVVLALEYFMSIEIILLCTFSDCSLALNVLHILHVHDARVLSFEFNIKIIQLNNISASRFSVLTFYC